MKAAYSMPDWLHSVSTVLVNYGVRSTARGQPQTIWEKAALKISCWLLSVTMKVGVWGRL
jgi:hypothetical protein